MAEGDDKPKGFDISKLESFPGGAVHSAADLVEQMTGARGAVEQGLRDIGGASFFEEATRAAHAADVVQNQLSAIKGIDVYSEQIRAQQEAMESHLSALTGAAGVIDQFKAEQTAIAEAQRLALGGLPEGYMDHLTGARSAVARLVEDMRVNQQVMFQHIDAFRDMRRSIDATASFDLASVLNIPRMDSIYSALGIDRIGQALAAADAASVLGLNASFNDEFRSIASLMNEQMSGLSAAQEAMAAALNFDLSDRLETLLARSIAAQEALVDEYRDAAKDAKVEAAFHRRIALISVIINVLMLFMTIALQIEDRMSDRDSSVRANTEALQQMRQSFDGMAAQFEEMQKQQEAASAAEEAADAAIAALLREIADSLANQADPEPVAEPQPSGLSEPPPAN